MPGTRCAVAICNNSHKKTKIISPNISYHHFPVKNETIYKAWVLACRRKDKWNPKTSVVCSQHFTEGDFEIDLRSQLLNISVRPKLKPSG